MLDDLMDEFGKEEPKKKTKPKSKKVKPKKSSKKKRVVEEKEPATVHGDDSTIPPIIHDYLVKRYHNVYYSTIGDKQDFNTRQFRVWDNEDATEDYTVRLNVEGGGRDVHVKEVYPNV